MPACARLSSAEAGSPAWQFEQRSAKAWSVCQASPPRNVFSAASSWHCRQEDEVTPHCARASMAVKSRLPASSAPVTCAWALRRECKICAPCVRRERLLVLQNLGGEAHEVGFGENSDDDVAVVHDRKTAELLSKEEARRRR